MTLGPCPAQLLHHRKFLLTQQFTNKSDPNLQKPLDATNGRQYYINITRPMVAITNSQDFFMSTTAKHTAAEITAAIELSWIVWSPAEIETAIEMYESGLLDQRVVDAIDETVESGKSCVGESDYEFFKLQTAPRVRPAIAAEEAAVGTSPLFVCLVEVIGQTIPAHGTTALAAKQAAQTLLEVGASITPVQAEFFALSK